MRFGSQDNILRRNIILTFYILRDDEMNYSLCWFDVKIL